jgi:addiction module HigA family antidote
MAKSKSLTAPGPFLASLLEKYNLNPFKLSKDIHLSQSAVRLIVLGKNKISVPVAFRLAKYFNTNPEFWLAMQTKWDIAQAEKDKALMKIIGGISRVKKGAPPPAKKPAAKKPAKAKKPAAKKPAKAKKPAAAKTTRGRKPARARKAVAVRRVTKPKKPVAHRKPAPAKKTVRKAAKRK